MDATQTYSPGLEGVVAGVSKISRVDPDIDSLCYRGYDVRELSQLSSYEEVAYLLLHDDLPNKAQLEAFNAKLTAERQIPIEVLAMLASLPNQMNTMDMLRTGVSMLSHFDPHVAEMDHE